MLLFDIDGLRDVNDSLGHDAGDQMIVEVAGRLRQIAPAAALVGRAGGDEFAVTLRLADADAALALASELRAALQEPMEVGAITLDVDVAVGVAVHPDHGTEAEALLNGPAWPPRPPSSSRTPVHLFHPNLQARSTHRLSLAADLRRALDDGEIEVYFQPKVALPRPPGGRRRVPGPLGAPRPRPGPAGRFRRRRRAHRAARPADRGGAAARVCAGPAAGWTPAAPLPVAVNLSARTLIDPTFPHRVADLLAEYGVPAELLTLEITEDGMVGDARPADGDPAPAARAGRPARGGRLRHRLLVAVVPAPAARHEVKIDRSFVQGMATDPGDLAIVRAVVDLARHFGLTVVAEGVESEPTVSLLEELGCDVGQGFLFSRAAAVRAVRGLARGADRARACRAEVRRPTGGTTPAGRQLGRRDLG